MSASTFLLRRLIGANPRILWISSFTFSTIPISSEFPEHVIIAVLLLSPYFCDYVSLNFLKATFCCRIVPSFSRISSDWIVLFPISFRKFP